MSYLVLARKWRPRSFDTLVGQEHVVRALTHALTTQRLHHAWLFTGTRGVGKTTLSRILAKSLNCETGITATPCGKCRACTEIDSGRFVDYLELDAASNRGVDEMTQLLEQAVYSPTVGRFKVYMIDEVHMLTGHAFNAMLKTLEEPPAHVKFILATTDPQKIPVTVLSRCLQFNLKQMPPESIVGHLAQVLQAEEMPFEIPALQLIGQAARGSMRDALSLTDQAIAFSAGNLTDEAVRSMLGTIDQRHLVRLLDALADGDGAAVLAVADELATRSLSYSGALGDLAVMLSQIAIAQRIASAAVAQHPLGEDLIRLATRLNPDAVQLFYSIAVHSRSELALAPDEYAGFAMACVRMLAFSAEAGGATVPPGTSAIQPSAMKPAAAPVALAAPAAVAPLVAAPTNFAAAVRAPEPMAAAVEAPVAPASAASAPAVSAVPVPPAAVKPAAAEPPAAAAVPAAATEASHPAPDVAVAVPAVRADAGAPVSAGQADASSSTAAVPADAVAPAPVGTPVSDMLSTSETVPTADEDTVLPATPGTADSAESGAVSPPAEPVTADEPAEPAPAADPAAESSAMPPVAAPAAAMAPTPAAAPAAAAAAPVPPVAAPTAAVAPTPAMVTPAAAVAPAPASVAPAAPVFVPPWDVTPEPAATAAPATVAPIAPKAAAPAAPRQPDPMDAPVNSPRAAMARALAGGPISPRSGNAGAARPPAGGQTPQPRQAAPARAPAPAAPPPRQSRSSGPPDLEPPPWLMDDAEPSFAAPPPGTQGRRDAAGAGGARESSRSQAASPNAARGAPASSQQSAPSSYQTRQPAAEPSSYQARQPAAEPSSYQARQPAAEPSYASSIDDDASDGDPRDADGSGFSSESADEGEAFASSAASDAAYYASAAVSGNAAQEAPAAAPAPTWTGEPGAPIRLDESWPALAARLPVRGIAAQLARQSELLRIDGNQFVLRVSARTLAEGQGAERLRSVLESHFGQPVRVSVEVGATGSDTAHAVEQSVRSARQQAAEEAILADPFVRTLMDNFGGQIVPNSISPVSPELPVKETPK